MKPLLNAGIMGHTPLSLEIHPLWNYARNVVMEKTVDGSDHYDGIVEEHFRTRKDLTCPARFFGGFLEMVKNMAAVYKDMNGFIDRKTIEPYFITEYWILYSGCRKKLLFDRIKLRGPDHPAAVNFSR